MTDKLFAIVLAAGKGTRMRSNLPKVLHEVADRPLLGWTLVLLDELNIKERIVVLGHQSELVRKYLSNTRVKIVIQHQQKGTGHAVGCCIDMIKENAGDYLVICGDTPLFKETTLTKFIKAHFKQAAHLSVLSTKMPDPEGYGRIIRDQSGNFRAIVEEKDASVEQKKIREVNTGVYIIKSDVLLNHLNELKNDNVQGEYYLTDLVGIAKQEGYTVEAFCFAEPDEALGVNSREQLSAAEIILLRRIRKQLMDKGVTFCLPETSFVGPEVVCDQDVFIGPGCIIKGQTVIKQGARLLGHCYVENAILNSGFILGPFTKVINHEEER